MRWFENDFIIQNIYTIYIAIYIQMIVAGDDWERTNHWLGKDERQVGLEKSISYLLKGCGNRYENKGTNKRI